MNNKFLVIGLGNPGKKYKLTRHNAGFMVVNSIAKQFKCSFKRYRKFEATKFEFEGNQIFLMKPTTYMNLSGTAVSRGIKKYGLDPANLLVISDDISLPLGKIRIKPRGGYGGHNGLKSIIGEIETDQFARLRIGISSAEYSGELVDFVLTTFSEADKTALALVIDKAMSCVLFYIQHGMAKAMNEYN